MTGCGSTANAGGTLSSLRWSKKVVPQTLMSVSQTLLMPKQSRKRHLQTAGPALPLSPTLSRFHAVLPACHASYIPRFGSPDPKLDKRIIHRVKPSAKPSHSTAKKAPTVQSTASVNQVDKSKPLQNASKFPSGLPRRRTTRENQHNRW